VEATSVGGGGLVKASGWQASAQSSLWNREKGGDGRHGKVKGQTEAGEKEAGEKEEKVNPSAKFHVLRLAP